MLIHFMKRILIVVLLIGLQACTTLDEETPLEAGKTSFQKGDYQAAFSALYPLAKEGNSEAQYAIGYILYYGKAGAVDREQGTYWIHQAALQGDPKAEQALGIIYANARFYPKTQA